VSRIGESLAARLIVERTRAVAPAFVLTGRTVGQWRRSVDHVPRQPALGTERIRGELLKLGIVVSNRSIRRYRWRRPTRLPSQTWRTFLRNHAYHLWAADHALGSGADLPLIPQATWDELQATASAETTAALADMLRKLARLGVPVTALYRQGRPVAQIARTARGGGRRDRGWRGSRGLLGRLWHGSVTEGVRRQTHCPVLPGNADTPRLACHDLSACPMPPLWPSLPPNPLTAFGPRRSALAITCADRLPRTLIRKSSMGSDRTNVTRQLVQKKKRN
jgi:nucleotide-binding universal stress UspA family protein